jgi:hypothetical protein
MNNPSLDELRQIEDIVGRFEAAWRRGERPRIEVFAGGIADSLPRPLVRQLLAGEIDRHRDTSEPPSAEEYRVPLPAEVQMIAEVFGLGNGATDDIKLDPPRESMAGTAARPGLLPPLPGYRIPEMIGGGAMGVVYKAWQEKRERSGAFKVIAPGASADRFRREARSIARIRSPHVVAVHDYLDQADGRALLVMDLIEGTDLQIAMKG